MISIPDILIISWSLVIRLHSNSWSTYGRTKIIRVAKKKIVGFLGV